VLRSVVFLGGGLRHATVMSSFFRRGADDDFLRTRSYVTLGLFRIVKRPVHSITMSTRAPSGSAADLFSREAFDLMAVTTRIFVLGDVRLRFCCKLLPSRALLESYFTR